MPTGGEFSGWYLRGDVGVGWTQLNDMRSTFAPGSVVPGFQIDRAKLDDSFLIGGGVGYQWNSWVRFDVIGEYRSHHNFTATESYSNIFGIGGCGARCFDTYHAFAADLLRAPYSPAQNDDVPVEFGTGWYIRGDIAAAQDNANGVRPREPARHQAAEWLERRPRAGYKFTNFLRADLTVDYRSPVTTNGIAGTQPCIVGTAPIINGSGVTIGSDPIFDNCTGIAHSRLNRTHVLANAYVDLGTWSRFAPYVGAGVGVNVTYSKAQLNWFMSNQNPYDITFTDSFSGNVFHEFMDTQRTGFRYNLAWALMGGVAIDLTPHLKLDIGYRYLSLGSYTAADSSGNTITKRLSAQEIRTGFRYVID